MEGRVEEHEQQSRGSTSTEGLIRITAFVNRKKDISEEQFHKYWAEYHGPLVTSWAIRCGVIKYNQVSTFFFTLLSSSYSIY